MKTFAQSAVTLAWFALMSVVLIGPAAGQEPLEPDSDGDGLSDFREVHKHLTDPHKSDSDGDGIPDGDWQERREFTYTVRAVMHIIKPINAETLTDDYQDGRVLDEHEDYVEIEVILYPFNTVAESINESGSAGSPPDPQKYLDAGPTTNWDETMAKALQEELAANEIKLDELSPEDAAQQLADFLIRRVNSEDSFTTFAVEFEDGKPIVPEVFRHGWEQELAKNGRTMEEQFDHELLGKGMFTNQTMGSCTSAAIYLSTGMKAAGIPARSIITVPVTDGSDPAEQSLTKNLTHHQVRSIVEKAHKRHGRSWASHTYNEVWLNNRWRRLNYNRLGQNILDEQFLGLMVHVNTYADHAQAGLSPWGRRNVGDKNDICGYSNPYSCISLSDKFGPYCTLENPSLPPALSELTIESTYWYDRQDDPPRVKTELQDPDTAGHLFLTVKEEATLDEYFEFFTESEKLFILQAPDEEPVIGFASRGCWIDSSRGVRDFYIYIPPEQYAKLKPDTEYRLIPNKSDVPQKWSVADDVRVIRSSK